MNSARSLQFLWTVYLNRARVFIGLCGYYIYSILYFIRILGNCHLIQSKELYIVMYTEWKFRNFSFKTVNNILVIQSWCGTGRKDFQSLCFVDLNTGIDILERICPGSCTCLQQCQNWNPVFLSSSSVLFRICFLSVLLHFSVRIVETQALTI